VTSHARFFVTTKNRTSFLRGVRAEAENSRYDLNTVFFVRYELRMKKKVRIEHTIPRSTNTRQHIMEEPNPWFSTRINTRPMKQPDEERVHTCSKRGHDDDDDDDYYLKRKYIFISN
jgi:hypothetical protein